MSVKVLENAQMKATVTETGTRTLDFYAASFSKTPDKNGDLIAPYAFDMWLKDFYAAGKPLPISYSHAMVIDGLDPMNIIGYAPADPEHVWVDSYGLRVRALLDMNDDKARKVASLIEQGVVREASIAYIAEEEEPSKAFKGAQLITRIVVREAGPTVNAANPEAVVLSIKALLDQLEEAVEEKVELKWDGAAAMRSCSSAADFRKIAFERNNDSDPATAAHWTLPHHPSPGADADPQGVAAALAAVNGGRGGPPDLKQPVSEVRSHLEAHSSAEGKTEEEPVEEKTDEEPAVVVEDDVEVFVKHASGTGHIQRAHDALIKAGAKCAEAEYVGGKTKEPDPPTLLTDEEQIRRRKFRLMLRSMT